MVCLFCVMIDAFWLVRLRHYEILLGQDLNPKTELRAMPKLTDNHVHPNNFQKISICQCCSAGNLFTRVNIYYFLIQVTFYVSIMGYNQ